MSFGGFCGSCSGRGESRDVRMMTETNTRIYTAMPHSQLVTGPISQPVFNSSPLSLALKPKMENFGEQMGTMPENFDPGAMGRAREDEYESRSGSDNLEGASGDDQEGGAGPSRSARRKKYHRHTPYQIQELEASFKDNPHPDEKGRLELGRKLGLESKQVKFWFQNRRTQMKTQLERHENAILKQENDKLRIENIAMKEAMRNPICNNCGGQAILGEVSIEEHHLRIENARLRDELNRLAMLANKQMGRPLSSFPGPMSPGMGTSSLELAVGRNGFGGLSTMDTPLPMGLDFNNGVSTALQVNPPTGPAPGMNGTDVSFDRNMFLELALAAMDELVKLSQVDSPLWFKISEGSEVLNLEEYSKTFPPCISMKPANFITEATRASAIVLVRSISLVDSLMDPSRWVEMFPCMIGKSSHIDVISSGTGGTKDGMLQLICAEFQVISSLVPLRQVKFLRFCKQHAEGVWAVVDISVDTINEGPNVHSFTTCRRLPSGCVVQDMPNGFSKVTWIEHAEYDENVVHHYFRPLIRSGMGFGAQRWVANLQRQCECLAIVSSSSFPAGDHAVITPAGRRSVATLAQRMTRAFCAGICATVHNWELVEIASAETVRLMMRKSVGNSGEPPGVVLSATTTVWLPVPEKHLFDYLRNEQTRNQWDVLSHDGPMQQMLHIGKGQDPGNNISLLRASATGDNANESVMLILQETCTDKSGSLIVYAAVDIAAMTDVMNGGESSSMAFLPSGFAIVPDCLSGPSNSNPALADDTSRGSSSGSLLTLGFQILINSFPGAKLTMESIETVNALISRTIQGIRTALQCS